MALLLTVLQALALMVLQHTVLTAVVAAAEAAVADDALRRILAVLERAADLLRGHAAAQRERHVQCGVGRDVVGLQGARRRREVLAGVDYAQVRGCGVRSAEGEERAERAY